METLDKIRERFKMDKFASDAAGAIIDEVGPDYAKCSMEVSDIHLNAVGGVMGGALFTLADFAFAVATNLGDDITVSQTSQITFLGAAQGKIITAEALCQKKGRTTCFYIVNITDELGTNIACVTITGFRKSKA